MFLKSEKEKMNKSEKKGTTPVFTREASVPDVQ